MPIGTFRGAGTGLFPLCLGILIMVLSGLFLLQLFLKGRAAGKRELAVEISRSTKQLIFFFGTMVLVTFFFNRLGYPLSSFLLMLALLRILGVKRWTLQRPPFEALGSGLSISDSVGTSIWLNCYHPLYFLNSSLTQIAKINQKKCRRNEFPIRTKKTWTKKTLT